jgi:hypothetical protein
MMPHQQLSIPDPANHKLPAASSADLKPILPCDEACGLMIVRFQYTLFS